MKGLSSDTARRLVLSVGTHRPERPLTPVEVGEALKRTLDAGSTLEELTEILNLGGPTMIRRFIRLTSLPPQVQPLIGWGSDLSTLSFTVGAELAGLDATHDQVVVAKAALENRLSKSEVIQVIQIRRRSGQSIEDSIEAVLRLRPVVERRFVVIGELLSDELKERLRRIPQLERNSLLRDTLKRSGIGIPPFGVKLGCEYFILVGDDHFHTVITALPKGFEQTITEYLMLELACRE